MSGWKLFKPSHLCVEFLLENQNSKKIHNSVWTWTTPDILRRKHTLGMWHLLDTLQLFTKATMLLKNVFCLDPNTPNYFYPPTMEESVSEFYRLSG